MKKFFYISVSIIIAAVSIFSFVGCKKNELGKVSKNLTAYTISAELNDEEMTISASETVIFYNSTEKDLDKVCFHLYPRAFREGASILPYTVLTSATCFPNGVNYGDLEVLAVKVNGKEKEIQLTGEDEDILLVELGGNLSSRKTTEINIDFKLTVPNSTHRFGYYESNINLGNWYPIVCKYNGDNFDMTPYYSTGDPFYSDIANYDVTIKYPNKYTLSSTGEINSTKSGEFTSSKMTAKAVRDFAMCLSSNASVVSTTAGGVNVFYMGYKGENNLDRYLKISKEAVEYFSNTFGNYPYSTLWVVKTPFIYGGMEYPNIVFISDSIDDDEEYLKVVVHEIAHQWWYGVVGNNEITEAWLDESLAEYSTALFFEHHDAYNVTYKEFVGSAKSSYLLYVDVINVLKGEVNTKMNLAVNDYKNDYEYSYMIYVKGVIMFDSLRNMVGEKKLLAGFKQYYSENKFKIASKNNFLAAFKSACHSDLEEFFNGYLDGTTIITKLN